MKEEEEESPDADSKDKPGETLGLLGRYGPAIGMVPAHALAGFLIGYGLDYLFSTHILLFVFLILGVVAGLVQLFRDLSRDIK